VCLWHRCYDVDVFGVRKDFLLYADDWSAYEVHDIVGNYLALYLVELLLIFGPKKVELGGGCSKLHNEELHNLYSSQNMIRMVKSIRTMGRTSSTQGEKLYAYRILVGNPG
jgi:predicted NBD/HSP70 family sugar kinase